MLSRRQFLRTGTALGLATLSNLSMCTRKKSSKPPNILMLMADDLGYSDLSCYGSKEIQTPVLDKLAAEGIRFTDYYAAAPNCSPSRAAIMTGRFPFRAGIYSYIAPNSPVHLRTTENTLPNLLRQAGYATAQVGKWHLNSDLLEKALPTPGDHGFDFWFATDNNAKPSHHNPVNFIENGEAVGKIAGYSCQIVANRAIQWLTKERQPDQPFFLNVWFHEPHRKVAAPPHLLAKHPDREDAAYLACVENMDLAIGRLLKQLEQQDLAENTLVLFTSDNGSYREGSNNDFRGSKSWVWEGGIRVPMIMRLPGSIQSNSLSAIPCCGVDLMPTFCDLADVERTEADQLDGQSLTPIFRNEPLDRKKPLFWFFYRRNPACALREGDWSLIGYLNQLVPPGHRYRPSHQEYIMQTKLNRFELYYLKEDPQQQNNVASKYPDRLQAMQQQMVTHHEQIITEFVNWF